MYSSKRQERPLRTSSYQGSYIDLPFRDTDDDAYDGRIFFGPYTSAAATKNQQKNSLIMAREMANNSQKAIKKEEKGENHDDCAGEREKNGKRQTRQKPHFSLRTRASFIEFEKDESEDEEEEKSGGSSAEEEEEEDIPNLIKAEPIMDEDNDVGLPSTSGSSSRSSNAELIPNLFKENGNSKIDHDKAMMPPPPLLWGKALKPIKVDENKGLLKKPQVKDWNQHLKNMYGSVEKAKKRPWMSSNENSALAEIGPHSKMLKQFSVQNWDSMPESLTDIYQSSPLFKFPKDDGLDREISKKLQFVRDSINLYRTLRLQNVNNGRIERPLFLPFLRRNLRYNNYIPCEDKSSSSSPKASVEREISSHDASSSASMSIHSETAEDDSHEGVDLSVRLLSIKNNLLPVGYKASVTFFYSLFKYKTGTFTKIFKIESSTVNMDVNADYPKNIDLPPELEYDPKEPYEVHVVLRTIFYDPSKDVYAAGKSLRNIPARARGKCERAREEEESNGKIREAKEGDTVMFGAIQITKQYQNKWTFSTGSTSLILIEAERLGLENNSKRWQTDKYLIPKLIALGRKHHTNPFVYIELNNGEEDDSSIASSDSKKIKKRRIIEKEVKPLVPVKKSKYDLPIAIVYQLSFDFMYKENNCDVEESQPQKITTGFNTVVINDYENLDTTKIIRPNKIKPKPKKHRATNTEPKPLQPEVAAALVSMDEKAPPPRLFTYHASRSPGYCIFCESGNRNLFALMCHYRTCHSRFNYVYRSAIEYKPGHFLPGFVLTPATVDEDLYWHQRKKTFNLYKKSWPQKFNVDNSFITPCNFLFQGVTDGLEDIAPLMTVKHRYNRFGSRPINYQHTNFGRLIKPVPDWWVVKMKRDLNDIVDLDPLEITFMMEWNKFLFLYGPITGKETNVYKLCRSFIETRRKEIIDLHLEIPTLTLVSHFVQNKILTSDELYDISMRIQTNYDPFTDLLHPLSINERRRAKRHIQKQEVQAEKLKRKRPKKVYEPSSISLRRRLADASVDDSRSRTGSVDSLDDDSLASSPTEVADSPSTQQDDDEEEEEDEEMSDDYDE